jgi:dipeptidyl aminopeptidase/acylaminoacyl peptidase
MVPSVESRALQTSDQYRLRWLSDPRVAPDGKRVAFVVSALDRERDALTSRIYLLDLDTPDAAPVCLTPADAVEHSPRWAPDSSRLALVSDRRGGSQIWIIDRFGHEVQQLTRVPNGAAEPAWHPDGRTLAFTTITVADESETVVHQVLSAHYKSDGVGLDLASRRRHVWLASLDRDGDTVPLTDGDWDDCAPAWSPDGKHLAFISNRSGHRDCSSAADVWTTTPGAGGARCLTASRGPVRSLAWSPDGTSIAYVGHDHGDAEGVNLVLWVASLAGGSVRSITAHLDRSIGMVVRADDARGEMTDITWSADGSRVYFIVGEGGSSWIGWATLTAETGVAVAGTRACLSFSLAQDRLAFVVADLDSPGELHLATADGAGERRLTSMNADWLEQVALAPVQHLSVPADDGHLLEGWLVRPLSLAPGKQVPLILQVHGGPHYAFGNRFSFEVQRLAAQGYLVLYGNPRGSQGYGEHHATRVLGDWGGRDLLDVLQLLDAVLATGVADPTRLAVSGVSYGGYLACMLIASGQQFRAAIAENGISDCTSVFGNGAGLEPFWCSEFGGPPWERQALYQQRSPLSHVASIHTPLLLVHAELDQQSPIGQSEELFAALRFLGRHVEFVRVPGEGHLMNLIGRPSRRIGRAEVIDRWLARYLVPNHHEQETEQ